MSCLAVSLLVPSSAAPFERSPDPLLLSGAFLSSLTSESTQTSTTLYTLTSSGEVVVVTSIITTVVEPSGSANGTSANGQGGSGSKSLNGNSGNSSSFFSNTGAVAGTFVVVGLVAAGIAIGLASFFLRRKKKRQLDEDIRVAAGGAGDGGAGVNRFAGEMDDEENPFEGGSEGHHSNGYHPPTMSSYGTVPLTAAAAAYASSNPNQTSASRPSFDHRRSLSGTGFEPTHSPSHSLGSYNNGGGIGAAAYAGYQAYGPTNGAAYPRGPEMALGSGTRSQEGALYPDWAEYVENETPGRSSGSGENGNGSGSAEGMGELATFSLSSRAELMPDAASNSRFRQLAHLQQPTLPDRLHARIRLLLLLLSHRASFSLRLGNATPPASSAWIDHAG